MPDSPAAHRLTPYYFLLALGILTAIEAGRAQGPAPSPILPRLPAQTAPQPSPAAPQTTPAPALTKADVETFLDALIPDELQNRNMAGAGGSVMKDSQGVVAKG